MFTTSVASLLSLASLGADLPPIDRPPTVDAPRIQIALLLDTSNSMDGLIEQAKSQLWKIVNEFALCKRGGRRPKLEVALYEYGNNGLSAGESYIRQVSALTTNLDIISEHLFRLKTNGGHEYCGAVVQRATIDLAWSPNPRDLKAIFIAGNEPFSQGPTDYRNACRAAILKGITVNTIHCGDRSEGARTGWADAAQLADGSFHNIDQNQALTAIAAPQDKMILSLGASLNKTYIAYGRMGRAGLERQQAQDSNADRAASAESAVARSLFKGKAQYSNEDWDLIDAVEQKKVKLAELKDEELPTELRGKSLAERETIVRDRAKSRADIRLQIAKLEKERAEYVAAESKKRQGDKGPSLDAAVIDALRRQATSKEFEFENP